MERERGGVEGGLSGIGLLTGVLVWLRESERNIGAGDGRQRLGLRKTGSFYCKILQGISWFALIIYHCLEIDHCIGRLLLHGQFVVTVLSSFISFALF